LAEQLNKDRKGGIVRERKSFKKVTPLNFLQCVVKLIKNKLYCLI
jgi:hypothetical protein